MPTKTPWSYTVIKKNQNYFSARSVITIIFGIFFLAGSAMGLSVFFFLKSLDEHGAARYDQLIDIGLEKEKKFISSITEEYSYWDEAYKKIFTQHDAAWIKEYSGQWLLDQYSLDFSVAIGPGMQQAYLAKSEDFAGMDFDALMASGLDALVEAVSQQNMKSDDTSGIINGYISYRGNIFLVSMQSFKDEISEKVRPNFYLATGKCLDSEYIQEIGESYRLNELHLTDRKEPLKSSRVLQDVGGNDLAYLTWTVPRLSLIVGPKIIGTMVLFFGSALCLAIFLIKREHSNRDAYEEKLFQEATLDPLTDLSNRRYFTALGQQEIASHKRDKQIFALIMLDIDHFKSINDTYGHAVGDKAIIHVTRVCTSILRESDIMGRIGGEEFAILLPHTPLERAVEVAHRIRERIEATQMEVDGKFIATSASIGVTAIKSQESLDDVLLRADKALYQAKEQGRNQVCVFA